MNRAVMLTTTALCAGLLSTQAAAQSQEGPAPQAQAASEVEEIVVTGSRLQQSVLSSPVPVTAVTEEQIEQAGTVNTADILTELGGVFVGRTDTNSQNFYALAGMNLVDLRRLGFNRTLTLVNGRRQVAGDIFTNAVDLNSIPAPLIRRVEVVTGGTSAIYGADAVSGVINVILKDDFEGLEGRVRVGQSSRGDAETMALSLTAGVNFAEDRGNLTATAYYDTQEGVKATARDYAVNGLGWISNPADTASNNGVPNSLLRSNLRYFGPSNQLGAIDLGTLGFYTVLPGGAGVRPYDYGEIGNRFGTSIGGDGGFFEQYDNLQLPIERLALATNLTYELAPNIELFLESRFITTHVETRWQPPADFEYGAVTIQATNPYVPGDLRALLAANNRSSFLFSRVYEAAGRRGSDSDRTTLQLTGGIRGEVLGRFDYELFAGYGRTKFESQAVDARDQAKFLQSTNVTLLNGQPVCADAAARAAGCQPLNVFNPSATLAGIEYARVRDTYNARNILKMAGASLSGPLFELPAGPVEAVIGVEARENTAETMPSQTVQNGGIQWLFERPISGKIEVSEAFGELRVPVLSELPFAHELTFQAAGRVSDYSTSGTTETWNLSGIYRPVEWLRLRAARSRAVRAPNVTELFSTRTQTFLNLVDPCSAQNIGTSATRTANCGALGVPPGFVQTTGSKATFTGGNPNLQPETADTWTYGVAFQPHFLPGLTATVDYFNIKIASSIGTIPAQTLLNTCVDVPGPPSANPACAAITRDPAFQIASVTATQLNLGALRTRGVDFNLSYGFDIDQYVAVPGRLTLSLNATRLLKLRQLTNAANAASEVRLEGNLGQPRWEASGSLTYDLDPVSLTWRTHVLGSTFVQGSTSVVTPPPPDLLENDRTGVISIHDLSAAYELNEDTSVRFNVNNVFDQAPPSRGVPIHMGRDNASIYPNLGRLFSAELTHRF
jgi:outer membrane receptor protein involved in Fe transport